MTSDPPSPPEESKTTWLDSGVAPLRADICQVTSSRSETTLLFGTRRQTAPGTVPHATLDRRIALNPALAKQLAAALRIAAIESQRLPASENATPAGYIHSEPSDEDAPPPARPLLQLVRKLGVGFGFEKSLKLSPGSVLGDRVILGVRSKLADPSALQRICHEIGMPESYVEMFGRSLPEANTVGFGFEGSERGGVFKVYLEFWEQLRQRQPPSTQPALLFLGFKWDATDSAKGTIARYTCYPLLPINGILQRLDALYDDRPESPSLQATQKIMGIAARRIGRDSFVYVEAAEEGNPRKSFDINFYKAKLRIAEILPALSALGLQYGVSDGAVDNALANARACPFGHLSGGLGRDGRDFLTAYYELDPL